MSNNDQEWQVTEFGLDCEAFGYDVTLAEMLDRWDHNPKLLRWPIYFGDKGCDMRSFAKAYRDALFRHTDLSVDPGMVERSLSIAIARSDWRVRYHAERERIREGLGFEWALSLAQWWEVDRRAADRIGLPPHQGEVYPEAFLSREGN